MPPSDAPPVKPWIFPLLSVAAGLIVANLYYEQPLTGPISAALKLSPEAAGLIVTMAQLGYVLGLVLLVPLGDLVENRKLIVAVMATAIVALAVGALAHNAVIFLVATLFVGIGSVAVQILVPFAAHLSPPASRGRVVGGVVSGVLTGIMLARPVGSIVTHVSSWRTVLGASALVMVLLAVVLWRALPVRRPAPGLHYGALLRSMGSLVRNTPVLRQRSICHAFLFAAFSVFWTAVPLLLARPPFSLSQAGIAAFALAGVSGALVSPLAGRLADRNGGESLRAAGMLTVAVAFVLMQGAFIPHAGLPLLVLAGILLDAGVMAHLVVSQHAIFMLGAQERSRLNGVFMATFFLGGAVGSALGVWLFARAGWSLTAWLGVALAGAALAFYATEWSRSGRSQSAPGTQGSSTWSKTRPRSSSGSSP